MRYRFTALVGWLILASFSVAWGAPPAATTQPSTRPRYGDKAAVISIHGPINGYTELSFNRRLEQARAAGATTIILELNTPGGMLEPTLKMTRTLRALSDMRTVAFVNPDAFSAGSLLAAACDEIVMGPDARLGDCAPIMVTSSGTLQSLGADERAKAESPVLADFRESAERNGYSPLLLHAMVQTRVVVHVVTDGQGRYRAVDEADYKKLIEDPASGWKRADDFTQPRDTANELLTLRTEEAIKLGLARGTARDAAAVARDRGMVLTGRFDQGLGEGLLEVLSSVTVRAILLSLFFTCLYIAFNAPGHGMPEVACMVLLAILVGVPLLTQYATWWEVLLILLGIALLALELFVIPGFGVTGITGIVLILGGLLMTFVAPEPGRDWFSLPTLPQTWTSLRNGLAVIVGSMVAGLFLIVWLRRFLPKLPYLNKLVLTTAVGTTEAAMVGSLTNIDPMEQRLADGALGTAATDLKPSGNGEFKDPGGGTHVIAVVSDSGFIPRGAAIRVIESTGNRVLVRKVN